MKKHKLQTKFFPHTKKVSLTFILSSMANLQSSFLGIVCHKISYRFGGPFLNLQSEGTLPFCGRAEESKGMSCQPCRWRSRRSDDSWGKPVVLQEVREMIERWIHLEMRPISLVNTFWIHQHQPSAFAIRHLLARWLITTAKSRY